MEKVFILTEGGRNIGMGHVSRCGAVYDEIIGRGVECELVVNSDDSMSVKRHGLGIMNWTDGDFSWLEGAYVMVDSYLASYDTLLKIASAARKVMYVDDYCRLDYPKGTVVNPSLHGEFLNYKNSPDVNYLLGKEYIILREPFRRQFKREISDVIETVTIIMGGADTLGLSPVVYEAVRGILKNAFVNIILGRAASRMMEVLRPKLDGRTKIWTDVPAVGMIDLFSRSDIVVSAAGQTCYELVQLRVPSILIKTAENQDGNIREMVRRGLAFEVKVGDISNGLMNAIKGMSCEERGMLAKNMNEFDFCNGVRNIVKGLLG